jgi:hypothetical protein
MEATEAIGAMWRAFPDLARDAHAPESRMVGFVSRAWRPIHLTHAPVTAALVRARV